MDSGISVRPCGTSRHRPRRRFACALASVFVVILAGWSQTLAKRGLIELGIATQPSCCSAFRVTVEGQVFTEGSHSVGETAASIADKVRANIDASPLYTATIPDPNCLTCIQIEKQTGGEPTSLEVFIDDGGIGGGFVDYGPDGGYHAKLRGADVIDPNADPNHVGTFEVDITVFGGGTFTHMISTFGKSATQVNAELVAALTADGFEIFGPPNGPWDIVKPCFRFQKIEMKRTNTGMHITGVGADSISSGPGGAPAPSIPTLSEWGLIALVALLGLSAALLIGRRRARDSI